MHRSLIGPLGALTLAAALVSCARAPGPLAARAAAGDLAALAASYRLERRAVIKVDHPAFLDLHGEAGGEPTLMVSSFGVFGGDAVRAFRGLGGLLAGRGLTPQLVTDKVVWPNEVKPVPSSVMPGGYLVAGGFLVPGKTGALTIVSPGGATRALTATGPVTERKPGFFYHRAMWRDMDGDGRLDVLTARAKKPIMGPTVGELVWLSEPRGRAGLWQEHVIAQGPDVHFRLADLDGDGVEEVLASEFFAKRFSVHWREGSAWRSRVVDNQCGAAFDLEVADLNGDGVRDVVLTNHEGNAKAGAFAYEIPRDWKNTLWKRHTLTQGIKTTNPGMNQASPGAPVVLPGAGPNGKALILLAGDGSQHVHLLVPTSAERTDWGHTRLDLVDLDSTVGQLAVADLDGDRAPEVFVPAYDKHQIHVFTLRGPAAGRAKRTR
ncbi:MAG: VCBS repeat-containing protein [Candidatus Sericytochromatia bacterium]|nr:VCBS repeat-containing protein [Candidatus Sericytochromatia bacterium]